MVGAIEMIYPIKLFWKKYGDSWVPKSQFAWRT